MRLSASTGMALVLAACVSPQAPPAPPAAWNVLADIPDPQLGCAGAVLGGKLHVLGGCTIAGGASKAHQVFDPKTGAWMPAAPLPERSGWPAAAVYKGRIYCFGGDCKGIDARPMARSFVYDPAKDAWSDIAPLPAPRSYAAATTAGEFIYVYGARTLRRDTDDLSCYRYDPDENTYTRMADLPEAARFITQGYYNGCIYVIHGETSKETYANGVLVYDIVHNEWKKLDLARPRTKWTLTQHSTDMVHGSRLYVAGGKPPRAKRTRLVTWFNMKTKTFGEAEPLPEGRCCGAGGIIDGALILAGGFWEDVNDLATCRPTWSLRLPPP